MCVSFTAVFFVASEPSRIAFPTCVEGDHVGHQLVKGEVAIQLASCCAAAALMGGGRKNKFSLSHTAGVQLPRGQFGRYLDGPSQQGKEVPADRQQDEHAVEVEAGGWSSGPGQSLLGGSRALQCHRSRWRIRMFTASSSGLRGLLGASSAAV